MRDDLLRQYVRPIDEPEPHEPSLVRGDPPLPRLEIRELDGNARSFPYAALQEAAFNASVGIRLVFADVAVSLGGLNLRRIFDAVHIHAAKAILVLSDETEAPDGQSIVTACSIEPLNPGGSTCS